MSVYFDVSKNRVVDLDRDICSLDKWLATKADRYSCAQHNDGFLIFLPPDIIQKSDEYKDADPYSVMQNIESDFQQRRLKSTIDLIRRNELSQLNILDLGCGEGHITNSIKNKFPSFNVFGLDYSISAIKYAHKKFPSIDFVVADAYSPPYPNNFFDIVVLNNIWEHVPDPLRLLDSVSRVLKGGGQIIISTPSRYRLINFLRILLGKKVVFMSSLHVTEYTVGQVIELLKFAGYDQVEIVSPSIKESKFILRVLKRIIKLLITLTKSHHIVESTVFYSAIKIR